MDSIRTERSILIERSINTERRGPHATTEPLLGNSAIWRIADVDILLSNNCPTAQPRGLINFIMAYNLERLKRLALEAIKEEEIVFISELPLYLPCVRTTFYHHKLHEDKDIIEAIQYNKISIKAQLRKNWAKSKNAILNLALYRLLANDDERKRLIHNKEDVGELGNKPNIPAISWTTNNINIQPTDTNQQPSNPIVIDITPKTDPES